MTRNFLSALTGVSIGLFSVTLASAQDHTEAALAAWQCVALARWAGETPEIREAFLRVGNYAMNESDAAFSEYSASLKAQSSSDLSHPDMAEILKDVGPDFMKGFFFGTAKASIDQFLASHTDYANGDTLEVLAAKEFQNRNCALIGP